METYKLIKEFTATEEQQTFEFDNLNLEEAVIYITIMPPTATGYLIAQLNELEEIKTNTAVMAGRYALYKIEILKLTNSKYYIEFKSKTSTTQDTLNFLSTYEETGNLLEATEINKILFKFSNGAVGVGTNIKVYGKGSVENG